MPFDGKSYPTIASRMLAGFGPNGERWCGYVLAIGARACLIGKFLEVACKIPHETLLRASADQLGMYVIAAQHPAFPALERAAGVTGSFHIAEKNDQAFYRLDFSEIRRILSRMHELEIAAMEGCSTCGMGLAQRLWPEAIRVPVTSHVAHAFGITEIEARGLFLNVHAGRRWYSLSILPSPKDLARAIDQFLAERGL